MGDFSQQTGGKSIKMVGFPRNIVLHVLSVFEFRFRFHKTYPDTYPDTQIVQSTFQF
jgi:hypothetical protein